MWSFHKAQPYLTIALAKGVNSMRNKFLRCFFFFWGGGVGGTFL